MPAGSLENDFEPFAAHSRRRNVVPPSEGIKRDEHFDLVFIGSFLEKVLHSSKISGALFTHIRDEENVACGLYLRRIHCPDNLQQYGQRARVVTNSGRVEPGSFAPNFDVCSFGKYSVEMSGDSSQRAGADPSAKADDIAFGIDFDIAHPALA